MVQILRVNAAAVVSYANLDKVAESPPLHPHCIPLLRMIQGILHKIINGFHQPVAITEKGNLIRAGQNDLFLFLFGPVGKMQLNIPHHLCQVFRSLFKRDGTGVQPCDCQQVFHQGFNPVKLLLRQGGKFFHGGPVLCLLLHQAVIYVQGCQRRFELMGNVGYGILQEFLFPQFICGMGV